MPALDYSKWDMLDDEDDGPIIKPSLQEKQSIHDDSMRMIAEWLKEADPRITEEQRTQLVNFIKVQHRGIHLDNTPRHLEIVAFLEAAADAGTEPLLHSLLALGQLCYDRAQTNDQVLKAQAGRMLEVAMIALNTVWASRCEGGSRALFVKLLRDRQSELSKRYRDLSFATEVIGAPPQDPRDMPLSELSWWTKLAHAMTIQLGAAVVTALVLAVIVSWFGMEALNDTLMLHDMPLERAPPPLSHDAPPESPESTL